MKGATDEGSSVPGHRSAMGPPPWMETPPWKAAAKSGRDTAPEERARVGGGKREYPTPRFALQQQSVAVGLGTLSVSFRDFKRSEGPERGHIRGRRKWKGKKAEERSRYGKEKERKREREKE